ncbi:hypothetical protein O181_058214 [Austropuccinia psidii MF-1]|uniref:glucan 1,3-beta-glucosidase n=1 Tax=Austropuccinia psidii MF-1 TaxID=1389203 RepID=A0A9Q3HXF3_9BASI|nr:hypothetical protein [Austropuccinia psidii MF-1]
MHSIWINYFLFLLLIFAQVYPYAAPFGSTAPTIAPCNDGANSAQGSPFASLPPSLWPSYHSLTHSLPSVVCLPSAVCHYQTAVPSSALVLPSIEQQRIQFGNPTLTLTYTHFQLVCLLVGLLVDRPVLIRLSIVSSRSSSLVFNLPAWLRRSVVPPFRPAGPASRRSALSSRRSAGLVIRSSTFCPVGLGPRRSSSPQPSARLPSPPRLMAIQYPGAIPRHHYNQLNPSPSPEPGDETLYDHRSPGLSDDRPSSPIYPPHSVLLDPSDPIFFPSRHFASSNQSRSTWHSGFDSDFTQIASDLGKHSSRIAMLDKSEPLETEGLVHPTTSKVLGPSTQDDLLDLKSSNALSQRRRKILLGVGGIFLIIIGVVVAVIVSLRKSNSNGLGKVAQDGTTVTASGQVLKLWGTNGDLITAENGTTFQYLNPLGGTWVAIPFNDTAKCQDDSPPLNQPWDYAHRRILGVNLGGWLVLEPFITPYLFEKFNDPQATGTSPTVVDEWTLSVALGDKLASTLEEHYKTFITEQDFMQIAAAGLNWIRLPVGWWMIETWPGEPFLAGVSFKYFLKAITWARKYGLRINLDLHAVPGSQNGYNHSGRLGSINFLVGLMGLANAQRSLNYIRTLTQFISQSQYSNVIPMFSVLNEAFVQKIGVQQIRSYYYQVYQLMRSITGFGQGKGPMMVIHDGFQGTGAGHLGWTGFLKGADRLGLDSHNYFAFDKQSNDSLGYNSLKPCNFWATSYNQTNTDFGFNFAGEYSLAMNDCGLWLNNIGVGNRYDGTYPNSTSPDLTNFPPIGSCELWNNYRNWSNDMKDHIADLAATSQDAMQNSFFWTWKISQLNRAKDGLKPNPLWDYQLGLQQGWIRPDARKSLGACNLIAKKEGTTAPQQSWSGEFADWQVGAKANSPTTSTIDPAQVALYGQWPPSHLLIDPGKNAVYNNVNNLPQYAPTGPILTLTPEAPNPKFLPASATVPAPGNGWANPADKAGWYVPIKGCNYPGAWDGVGLPEPTAPFCGSNVSPSIITSSPNLRRRIS